MQIEKTVFISYRRANSFHARAIFQALYMHGYDVFYDIESINAGSFEQIILNQIKARAHFVIVLTPTALERCINPEDWVRREIETAIEYKRNIIPLLFDNFEFQSAEKYLVGQLRLLPNYNGLRIHTDYFNEGMERLRTRFLNKSLDLVLQPVSLAEQKVVQEQIVQAATQPTITPEQIRNSPKTEIPNSPKIFICYRRVDSRIYAGRIYDRLVQAFGVNNVFMDVNNNNIPLGRDFRGVLREAVARCDVLLVLIGKQWIAIADENGVRRLDNPSDFVRIEIESGLQRDSCLVIPLTLEGAYMPSAKDLPETLRELAFKNGTAIRDDPDFHNDMDRVIRSLGSGDSGNQGGQSYTPPPQPTRPSSYNVYEAIDRYHASFEAREWENARAILKEIITYSPVLPRTFNVTAHEKDIQAEIEAEEREREYNVLRRMAKSQNPNAARIWEGLQAFWESFPDYDPDNLIRFKTILAKEYFDRAEKYRDNGEYDEAIDNYTRGGHKSGYPQKRFNTKTERLLVLKLEQQNELVEQYCAKHKEPCSRQALNGNLSATFKDILE